MSLSFHEIRFPTEISWGASGGPRFSTQIYAYDSGREQRRIRWADTRAYYEVGHTIKTDAQLDALLHFFYARNGRAYGFRFQDPMDYQANLDGSTPVVIGTGDGTETQFQLIKIYGDSANTFTRTINKPVDNSSIRVYKGVTLQTYTTDYSVDFTTGVITFVVAPLNTVQVKAYYEFDVPCRFNIDDMKAVKEMYANNAWESIPIVEIKTGDF